MRRAFGPGIVVAAAFIGPGTVTTATLAGADYGYGLVWALVFATGASIVLQDMAVRLGVVSRKGLGEAILDAFANRKLLKRSSVLLILAALAIGNAAFEGGNIAGASLGLAATGVNLPRPAGEVLITLAGATLLILGGYRAFERALIAIVVVMCAAFVGAFVFAEPDLTALFLGASTLAMPSGSGFIVLGLIGTTIVPYNLFLHAAIVRGRFAKEELGLARFDSGLSIGIGGMVSMMILSTAAAAFFGSGLKISNAADMARQLEPLAGSSSRLLMGLGLLAAGFSSAITAPVATAYAACELLKLPSDPKSAPFRAIAIGVLLFGAMLATSDASPVSLILFAQAANGLLLPLVAGFLLYIANRKATLGRTVNGVLLNLAGATVLIATAAIGGRALWRSVSVIAGG